MAIWKSLMSAILFMAPTISVGCSSPAKAPAWCNRSDRHGIYLAEYAQQSGTCGPITSVLVDLDHPGATTCAPTATTWTENNCRVSVSLACKGTATLAPADFVSISTQETADGSVLDGTETMSISGSQGCTSTYGVRLTRQ